jgi:1-acyl-sn-glycerol-3-phosphate acyltransferase
MISLTKLLQVKQDASTNNPTNSAIAFRPAKHSDWIIWIFHFLNSLDSAWHNRLHIDSGDLEILKNIPNNSGLILTANHSDEMDPTVVFELSRFCPRRFTYMINAEAFEEFHGIIGWWLQHLGGFSIERGGINQLAKRYAV